MLGAMKAEMILLATMEVMGRTKKGMSVLLRPADGVSPKMILGRAPRTEFMASSRRGIHTTDDQRQDEVRHQSALGIVQVVLVAEVGLGLAADGVFLALLPALGDEALALGEVRAEVLGHPAALGQHNGLGIGAGGRDADDGRLAERVHLLELRGR